MKIAFVTGCLEPGRDGVGDYVRTLALECQRRGHTVALVSLAESRLPKERTGEPFPLLRVSLAHDPAGAGRAARAWLDAFAPDWTSLHFVPYSFHPRGFFGGKIPLLAHVLAAAPRRQVFFHELWIGSAAEATWKQRATGWWQRYSVHRLLGELRPAVVHTSNRYYIAALATLGAKAEPLAMFGNVPVPATMPPRAELPDIPPDALVCGMFGSLHPNWQYTPFLADLAELARRLGRPAVLAPVGTLRHGTVLFERIAAEWRGRVTCMALGEHPASRLAEIFARFDFGVTASPWNLIGKSSSAAALREHGLSVVVTNPGSPPRFGLRAEETEPGDAGFLPYFRNRALLSTVPPRTPTRPGAAATAAKFLADLERRSPPP